MLGTSTTEAARCPSGSSRTAAQVPSGIPLRTIRCPSRAVSAATRSDVAEACGSTVLRSAGLARNSSSWPTRPVKTARASAPVPQTTTPPDGSARTRAPPEVRPISIAPSAAASGIRSCSAVPSSSGSSSGSSPMPRPCPRPRPCPSSVAGGMTTAAGPPPVRGARTRTATRRHTAAATQRPGTLPTGTTSIPTVMTTATTTAARRAARGSMPPSHREADPHRLVAVRSVENQTVARHGAGRRPGVTAAGRTAPPRRRGLRARPGSADPARTGGSTRRCGG